MSTTNHLPLAQDPSTRLMPWLIGFLVFIAVLASAGSMLLNGFANMWDTGLTGSLSIQVPKSEKLAEVEYAAQLEQILSTVQQTTGIEKARILELEEVSTLLEPWLGENLSSDTLPIPSLVEVYISSDISIDFEALGRQLNAIIPGTIIDTHDVWRSHMIGLLNILRLVAFSVIALVSMSGIIMVVFATRGGLVAHREVIEVLHLIGARDGFIARQFQGHVFWAAFRGAVAGMILASSVIWGLGEMASNLNVASIDEGELVTSVPGIGLTEWVILSLIPPLAALIATMSARHTVLTSLKRML